MRIGIDIDETLAASFEPVFLFAKSRYGFSLHFEDLTHHDWSKVEGLGISKGEELQIFRDFYKHFGQNAIIPVVGSIEGCKNLQRAGHELFAITGRPENMRMYTEEWMSRYFPDTFSDIFFTDHLSDSGISKSDICHRIGITEMVDDNMDFAIDLTRNHIKTHLIQRPWNQHRTEVHPLLVRIPRWHELRI